MSKITFGLFMINLLLLLVQIALMLPISPWQYAITFALGGVAFRSWRAHKAREEMLDSIYGRYGRADTGKKQTYHGL